jgi:hypothetical protein
LSSVDLDGNKFDEAFAFGKTSKARITNSQGIITLIIEGRVKLIHEPRAGSGEHGKWDQGVENVY